MMIVFSDMMIDFTDMMTDMTSCFQDYTSCMLGSSFLSTAITTMVKVHHLQDRDYDYITFKGEYNFITKGTVITSLISDYVIT